MEKNNKEIGRQKELHLLKLAQNFGWIRLQEAAKILWPHVSEKSRYQYATLLFKRLAERKQIHVGKLPENAGKVAVLTYRGAKEIDCSTWYAKAKMNDDYVWKHPRTWQHDLISQSFFALLSERKFLQFVDVKDGSTEVHVMKTYKTDGQVRGTEYESNHEVIIDMGERKIPDLLVGTVSGENYRKNSGDEKTEFCLAFEVENAPKTGVENLKPLGKMFAETNRVDGRSLFTYGTMTPTHQVLVFDKSRTYNGEAVAHLTGLINMCKKYMRTAGTRRNEIGFRMYWVELELNKYTVTDYRCYKQFVKTKLIFKNEQPTDEQIEKWLRNKYPEMYKPKKEKKPKKKKPVLNVVNEQQPVAQPAPSPKPATEIPFKPLKKPEIDVNEYFQRE